MSACVCVHVCVHVYVHVCACVCEFVTENNTFRLSTTSFNTYKLPGQYNQSWWSNTQIDPCPATIHVLLYTSNENILNVGVLPPVSLQLNRCPVSQRTSELDLAPSMISQSSPTHNMYQDLVFLVFPQTVLRICKCEALFPTHAHPCVLFIWLLYFDSTCACCCAQNLRTCTV